MLLERVEIVGFRGINRLSLMLEQNNVLIGENAWGKSSLLDALTLLLSPEFDLYHFVRDDFWFPPGDIQGREHHLHIILTFRETEPGRHRVRRFRPLQRCWVPCDDGYHRVFYRLEGELAEDDSVMTLRSFIDGEGEALVLEEIDELARHLVRLMPVLRLRDARFMRRIHNGTVPHSPQIEITARQLDFLSRELVSHPQNLSDGQIRQGLSAMVQLLEHYFAEQSSAQTRHRLMRRRSHDEQRSWRYLDIINRMIDKPGGRSHRVILLGLFATLLQAKGTVRLDRDARPLLLIEDPETRLHPIMLSVAWHLLNLLPLQRVTTTNSGELLSLTPVEQVCRLVRESTRVSAWRLGPGGMNAEESRRIAFHIRFNRASSLFARCWLLVDGDEAGKKYAATVRGLLNNDRELERDHLTSLPALDMEHFMYRQGFDDVYHRVAQIPDNVPMNMRRVITKAIHRSSKPDLAIEVAMEAGRRGVDAVPTLLKKMFSRVLWLARGRAD
ncbi:TPA: YjbD family protein [Klebsiella pneumoniae]|nr:YjbD family protein [Klebsiella pneumoniae]